VGDLDDLAGGDGAHTPTLRLPTCRPVIADGRTGKARTA
jgi:hypothetical protein